MLTVHWHPRAFRNVRRLQDAHHVIHLVGEIANDPFSHLHHFEHVPHDHVYKLRVGHYRAVVNVDLNKNELWIQQFDHRKRVYK